MVETALTLIPLGLVLAGWLSDRRDPELARLGSRSMTAILFVVLSVLAVAGIFHGESWAGGLHRHMGHSLFVFTGMSGLYIMGALCRQYLVEDSRRAGRQFFATLLLMGLATLGSYTGYLGPSHHPAIDEETRNRFIILHEFVLPIVAALLLVEWWWFFRRRPETDQKC